MRCVAYATANNYQLPHIAELHRSKGNSSRFFRSVLHVAVKPRGDLFFFSHGCFVAWGLSRRQELQCLALIKKFSINPLENSEIDRFVYKLGKKTKLASHISFNADVITIEADEVDNVQLKLAISYGLAQSIKLETYETSIQATINHNSNLAEELARHGKIPLARKEILKRMGSIFAAKSMVNLSSEYLDVPEYFWQFPNLEAYYIMTDQFLDISGRVEVLNQKLDVLSQLLSMLTSELQHKHSSLLEMIIILLIVIEIIMGLFHLMP